MLLVASRGAVSERQPPCNRSEGQSKCKAELNMRGRHPCRYFFASLKEKSQQESLIPSPSASSGDDL
jgi:hypothetical protein